MGVDQLFAGLSARVGLVSYNEGHDKELAALSNSTQRPSISRSPAALRMQLGLAPDLLLGEVEQSRQHDKIDHHLQADPLALVEARLGRPHQEGGDVLAVLLDRLRRSVLVGDLTIEQR